MPTKYALKCVIALICVFFLNSCENSKQPQLVTTVTPLASIKPSGGIERISLSHPLVNSVYHIYSKNLESKYLIPDVRGEIDRNLREGMSIEFPRFTGNPFVEERAIEYYQENVTLQGQQFNITKYSSVNKFAHIYFAHKDSELVDMMTFGMRATVFPIGRNNYRGVNLLTVDQGEINVGEFHLDIDFNEGYGYIGDISISENSTELNDAIVEIQGSHNFNYVRLVGKFKVNIPNGTFSGDDMTLQLCEIERCRQDEPFDDVIGTIDASIHGSLLGEGATGLAGIYHNKEDGKRFIGALVGERHIPPNQ